MPTLYGNPVLQAAVESAQRIIDQDSSDPHSVEELDRLINNINTEVSRYDAIDVISEQIKSSGMISTHDVHRLEKVSPGIITNHMSTDDFTFAPSVNGFEGAVEAIDWKKAGKWGIIGAIITAILGLIFKLFKKMRESYKKDQERIKEEQREFELRNERSKQAKDRLNQTLADQKNYEEEYKKITEERKKQREAQRRKYAGREGAMLFLRENLKSLNAMRYFENLETNEFTDLIEMFLSKSNFDDDNSFIIGGSIRVEDLLSIKSINEKINESWKEKGLNLWTNIDEILKYSKSFDDGIENINSAIEKTYESMGNFVESSKKSVGLLDGDAADLGKSVGELMTKFSNIEGMSFVSVKIPAGGVGGRLKEIYSDTSKPSYSDPDYWVKTNEVLKNFIRASEILQGDVAKSLKKIQSNRDLFNLIKQIKSYQSDGSNYRFKGTERSELKGDDLEVMKSVYKFRNLSLSIEDVIYKDVGTVSNLIKDFASAYLIIDKHMRAYDDLHSLNGLYSSGYKKFCEGVRVQADLF